ncbi:MAG: transcription repressor NadR [Lachnospira sp.]|nr:transcription repressor NadR [Lachnospira sp.]
MNGEERRAKIIDILSKSKEPISGTNLAKLVGVSRQVVVQDMALLRAGEHNIVSTNQGYMMAETSSASRVFKVIHTDEEVEEELSLIVDCGGRVEDVFVYHKVYNVVKGTLNIRSRLDVKKYIENLAAGKSSLLKNVTSGYHYHTVTAESEEILDYIQEELAKRGFLAQLQDYEPVNFWGDEAWD